MTTGYGAMLPGIDATAARDVTIDDDVAMARLLVASAFRLGRLRDAVEALRTVGQLIWVKDRCERRAAPSLEQALSDVFREVAEELERDDR